MRVPRTLFNIALLAVLISIAAPLRALAESDPQKVRVYFLTGGPVDVFSRDTTFVMKRKLEASSRELKVPVEFKRYWCMRWKAAAKQILASKGRDKIALIGHSWGGAAAVQAANYLNGTSPTIPRSE